MDSRSWYEQQANAYADQSSPTQGASSSTSHSNPLSEFQEAQRVLSSYPFASATPASSHVTRHLDNFTMTAPIPSYIQPQYYSHHQGNPPPYTEYAELAAPSFPPPGPRRQYWEESRDDAVRLLVPESAGHYPPVHDQQWIPASYGTPPFAAAVMQRTLPFMSSSSSLALALGDPQKPSTSSAVTPAQPQYRPQESAQFFDTFIAETSNEIVAPQSAPSAPPSLSHTQQFVSDIRTPVKDRPASVPEPPVSSPDPLAGSGEGFTTPRKRKPDELTSPTLKRIHPSEKSGVLRQRSGTSQTSSPSRTTTSSGSQPNKRLSVFVELPHPPRGWSTPSTAGRSTKFKSHPSTRTEDDLGGFSPPPESEWEDDHKGLKSGSKSTGKRTGDRDERVPLEKLTAFIEDVFEAEDSIQPDAELSTLPKDWFSPHTVDATCPLLAEGIIRKLTKLTSQIARPRKRMRLARDSPRKPGSGTLSEMEMSVLSRLLKILERSVKVGEDVDPFGATERKGSPAKASGKTTGAKKGKAGKSAKAKGKEPEREWDGTDASGRARSKSRTPLAEERIEGGDAMDEGQDGTLTEQDFQKLEKLLEAVKESVLAADCCIALLAADKLPKQLYSEELITACFATIKNQLTKVIYPYVEATGDIHGHATPILMHVVKSADYSSQIYRREIGETFQALTAVLPRINALVGSEVAMSDAIVIQAVYIAIGPFFVVEMGVDGKGKKDSGNNLVLGSLGGKGAMRALRLEALSLIRSIFANHEDQRSWIIEEILTSLIKLPDLKQKSGQFRLRDGRTIHTVSALLFQLVQTSAHDVRLKAKRLAVNRQQSFVMRHESQMDGSSEAFLSDRDHEEIQLYAAGLDSAYKAARTIVLFLTQRSGKGKATKSSNEAEYRAIFDNLISDLLTVLYWPEWPAAALLLRIICRFMVSSLSDKVNNSTDNNAAKTVALDHLGVIAARLTTSSLKFRNIADSDGGLKSLEEVIAKADQTQLNRLISIHQDISNHLAKRSSEDHACDSARELAAVGWGHELTSALTHCNTILQRMEKEGESSDHQAFRKIAEGVKSALRNVWQEAAHDVFDIGSEEDAARVDLLAERLGTTQSLSNAFDAILNVILVSLDATAVFMRTKALRALGQIVTADPGILRNVNVQKAIETHLLDSSPQVRDAAVELIGKYVVSLPEVAGDYYDQISERIADTGLAVRKRVIKLLRTFYSVSSQNERRVDICIKLVLRMNDEDDTVKDLAIKTIEDIWFGESHLQDVNPKANGRSVSSPLNEKSQLIGKVSVIMGVSSQFRDRQSPLEELLHKVIIDKDGKDSRAIHDRYAEIGNTLIDCLVDAQELPGFTVVNCIKTIYLFASAHPPIISTQQATTLLPYLKNATTAEEQITSDYLLKIFRVATPGMSKTASKFAHELQSVLQQMLMKPTGPNWVATLQEVVACICSVVRHLTHDFHLLIALLKSCNARLREHLARPISQVLDVNTKKKLNLQVFIASLLCEHCDFDKLRVENVASASELVYVSQGSLTEHIYGVMLQMYEKFGDPMIRARLLDCLGFLFRAYPTLMTLESSATIMDAIFTTPDEEARGRLLKIMQDFLITESTKQSAQEKASHKTKNAHTKVNMEELVGNTDGFADSGVSSAIVQRYLPQILEAAMTRNVQMQAAAVDILGFTVKQGLAHPLQCLPVIIALETSPNPNLSNRTGALHTILYNKHHSLMNSRHLECARASFVYQRKVTAGIVRGYRLNPTPTALLHRWYTLVREKRASRQDFLKTITKAFDIDSTNLSSTQDDVDFVRYMAENVSAFDYKTQEETLTVIRHLTSVLSVVGMALVETISPTTLRDQAREVPGATTNEDNLGSATSHSAPTQISNDGQWQDIKPAAYQVDVMNLARCSVAVSIILLLKSHLKSLYGLTEDKCSKWVPGKKSALGDKPATKRREVPLVWDRMLYATQPLRTEEEALVQQTKFMELWAEDPVTAEPEDDPME